MTGDDGTERDDVGNDNGREEESEGGEGEDLFDENVCGHEALLRLRATGDGRVFRSELVQVDMTDGVIVGVV